MGAYALKKIIIKTCILILIIASLVFIAKYFHVKEYLSIEGFNKYRDQIIMFQQANIEKFVLGYIIAYIVLIACCIPGTILFDLIAGFLFGYFWGTLLVVFSYSVGAVINFLLIKYIFKEVFAHKFNKFKNLVQSENKSRVVLNLIGLRLIPIIPFWVLNIVTALLNVSLKVFLFSTVIGIIPASIIYVIIGDGIRDVVNQNQQLTIHSIMNVKILLPLFFMSFLMFIPTIVKKIKS